MGSPAREVLCARRVDRARVDPLVRCCYQTSVKSIRTPGKALGLDVFRVLADETIALPLHELPHDASLGIDDLGPERFRMSGGRWLDGETARSHRARLVPSAVTGGGLPLGRA